LANPRIRRNPDMSELGAGHVRQTFWNPVRNSNKSVFSEIFGF
jgi:hypothetical protein